MRRWPFGSSFPWTKTLSFTPALATANVAVHQSVGRMRARTKRPRCIVIAGPNGAGKTMFAREFLPKDAGVIHFVNADLNSGTTPVLVEQSQ